MDWSSTFQEYVNMDPRLLLNIATNNADEVHYTLEMYMGYGRAKRILTQIFAAFSLVDGTVSLHEYELFRKVTDTLFDEYYTYSEFEEIAYEAQRGDFISVVSPYLGGTDLQSAIIKLGLAISAIDGCLSVPEQKFIWCFDR